MTQTNNQKLDELKDLVEAKRPPGFPAISESDVKAIVTELFPMTMNAYAHYKFKLIDTEVSNG